MTVSDSSPYWVAEQMLWNALEDTDLSAGANLAAWRAQQNPMGNAGTNYKTGAIPDNEALDTPALYFQQGEILTPVEYLTMRGMDRWIMINIIGELRRQSHREAEVDKLIKAFQYLVEKTLGEAIRDLLVRNSSYLPSGETSHGLVDIQPTSPSFPAWTEEEAAPIFVFPVLLQLTFSNIWLL